MPQLQVKSRQYSVGDQVGDAAKRSHQSQLLVDGTDLRIIDINDACYALLGYPQSMLLSLRLVDLVAEKDQHTVKQAVDALSDGSAWHQRMLCHIRRGDNGEVPVSLSLEVDSDPASSRTKLLVSLSDIAESEQLYLSMETALRAANISFFNWSLSKQSLPAWSLSSSEESSWRESNASSFLETLDPSDQHETQALLDAVSTGILTNIDTTVTTTDADGSKRWLRLTGVVPPHRPSTLLALQNDVTESYRLREVKEERERAIVQLDHQLNRSEAEQQELLALIPDFIIRMDQRARIKYASPSFVEDCGSSAIDVVGASLISLLTVDTRSVFSEALDCLHKAAHKHEFISEDTHNGKERSVWWTLLKVDDENERGVLCLGRDLTERVQARKKLERQAAQLRRSNASLDDFASVVAHDLQAPLRHIASFAEILQLDLGDVGESATKNLDIIRTATTRLQDMTTSLLNYSRLGLQNDRMVERDTSEIVAEAIDALSQLMKESGTSVTLSALPKIKADPLLMARLFQNLLANSIKYCDASITPEIHVSASFEDEAWTIRWADKGIGIDPAQSERIFQIFTRLHSDESVFAGSGVGLATCKRIVESHGGEIWLDTDYSEGACFCIRLPAEEGA